LGGNWFQTLVDVILPNLRVALLSGALITLATVIGELILADFLVRPAFGPYIASIGTTKAYEPAALTIMSFALTWVCLGIMQMVSRGGTSQQLTGR
jgi:putative spermidine/putrescine transport system permease protein